MQQSEIESALKRSIGKTKVIRFGGNTETVQVVSVDPDGFICRLQASDPNEIASEFWIPFNEVSEITEE